MNCEPFRQRFFLAAIALVLANAVGLMSAAPAAATDIPASVGQCFNRGWQGFVRDDGSAFVNQGACVSYLARGGTLGCPAPQLGPGPLTGGATVGAGKFDVTGSGFTTWQAYYYVELTLDGCGTVRFYNFETASLAVPGGQLGQACPAIGTFWTDTTIHLNCYLIAGRTVRAITIYDTTGAPVGYLATAVAVPPMPGFQFGSTSESAPQQLTLPVLSGNAGDVSALQIFYVPNMAGYSACGSGNEFWLAYFAPTNPYSIWNTPAIQVVTWEGSAITLDVSNMASPAYPGGFTLCGIAAYWDSYVASGTSIPATTITFG